ncbi:MAG: CoB--CoM heterodisulfide reductase iron-sulfur subunit B family protein [Candidatus Tectomicrobia bacterium]|nr:CoB--CoM heterodisulfide reductase iron-sulfur subunit B family protein [Candidatus Tectomicrobia bacterium]
MQYAFYPGCVSKGGCPELYPAALKVCERLGIDLVEMTDVGCTGAGVLPAEISDPINARTFAQAEAQGLPIMTICSTCTGVMTQANARLQEERYREAINAEHLAEEGLRYRGATKVKHLLWVLFEDYGLEKLKEHLTTSLEGLRVAPFYGCYIRRPSDLITKDFKGRKEYLDELIEALGAEVTEYSGKGKCCGFPILTSNERNSLAMAGNHTHEAKSKGADCMVTPCPLCHLNLDGNQDRAGAQKGVEIDLPVLHLPQLLGLAMGFSPDELQLQRHLVDTRPLREKMSVLA